MLSGLQMLKHPLCVGSIVLDLTFVSIKAGIVDCHIMGGFELIGGRIVVFYSILALARLHVLSFPFPLSLLRFVSCVRRVDAVAYGPQSGQCGHALADFAVRDCFLLTLLPRLLPLPTHAGVYPQSCTRA